MCSSDLTTVSAPTSAGVTGLTLGTTAPQTAPSGVSMPDVSAQIKQMQDYAAGAASTAASAADKAQAYLASIFTPTKWYPVPGTNYYTDGRGNIGQKVMTRDASGNVVARIQ